MHKIKNNRKKHFPLIIYTIIFILLVIPVGGSVLAEGNPPDAPAEEPTVEPTQEPIAEPTAVVEGQVSRGDPIDRYVAKSGTDSGDCSSISSPCLTVGYAIGQSSGGDTIHIGAGTYLENLLIDKELTLIGVSMEQTFLDGNNSGRVVFIYYPYKVMFVDLTIQNGNATSGAQNGGGICSGGELQLERVRVRWNISSDGGGGIMSDGNTTITDSAIYENETTNPGGGIWVYLSSGESAQFTRVAIHDNQATASSSYGGGLNITEGSSTITNVTISGNSASQGAAINNSGDANTTLINVTIANNTTSESTAIINYATMNFKNTSLLTTLHPTALMEEPLIQRVITWTAAAAAVSPR